MLINKRELQNKSGTHATFQKDRVCGQSIVVFSQILVAGFTTHIWASEDNETYNYNMTGPRKNTMNLELTSISLAMTNQCDIWTIQAKVGYGKCPEIIKHFVENLTLVTTGWHTYQSFLIQKTE